jgi:hypothetical protein
LTASPSTLSPALPVEVVGAVAVVVVQGAGLAEEVRAGVVQVAAGAAALRNQQPTYNSNNNDPTPR